MGRAVGSSAGNVHTCAWQQGTATSSISVVVKKPAGIAAKAALDEYEDPIELSLVGNALSGYMRQCKVVSDFKVEPTKDGEKINFKLSWAGKARLAKDIERRANDKFNTARAFKKEVRCGHLEMCWQEGRRRVAAQIDEDRFRGPRTPCRERMQD